MKKLIYITFGDQYSGIYQSQVIDVCSFYEEHLDIKTKLISFVPYIYYKKNKQLIKSQKKETIILPMIPSRNHWYYLYGSLLLPFLFKSLFKNINIISRGAWITKSLTILKKIGFKLHVIYDGRGAVKAEWEEYIGTDISQSNIQKATLAERDSVLLTDRRIAVSSKLIEYWRENYGYSSSNHEIIPCTINKKILTQTDKPKTNNNLKIDFQNPVIVFSGGADKWQSFNLIVEFAEKVLSYNYGFSFLFLTHEKKEIAELIKKYPDKIDHTWVKPEEVNSYLKLCDYGLLLRENSVTNRVASPTKLAEYIACGLIPIISDNIGDFSDWLIRKKIAVDHRHFLKSIDLFTQKPSLAVKRKNKNFAKANFLKENYKEQYIKLLRQPN
ncbi:MAG: hypothetical protein PWR04_1531 [Anaerophaga sp.]|nr:hypothetical protein [Anaerophaga sp.]